MNQAEREFVEQMGLVMESEGASRTFGRVLGLLILSDEPLSLDEMAEHLQVSKASVSTNARVTEERGLARRVSRPGDRRDYYQMSSDPFTRVLQQSIPAADRVIEVARRGQEALGPERDAAVQRLEEMEAMYRFLQEELEEIIERWKQRRNEGTS